LDTTAVREAIESAGVTLCFLPTYSPELNPIELWWADLKRELRRLAIDSQVELVDALRRLRAALPLDKIAGWFRFAQRQAQIK
jgi:transposase